MARWREAGLILLAALTTSAAGAALGASSPVAALSHPFLWIIALAWAGLAALLLSGGGGAPRPAELVSATGAAPPEAAADLTSWTEGLPVALLAVDSQQRITSANRAARELIGRSVDQLLGGPIEAALGAGWPPQGVVVLSLPDGTRRSVEVVHAPPSLAHPGLNLLLLHPLPERVMAFGDLEGLVVASPNPALLCGPDGRLVRSNGPAERLFGYRPGEMEGLPLSSLVSVEHREAHGRNVEAYFRDPGARTMRAGRGVVGLRRDQSPVHLEIGLTPFNSDRGAYALAAIADLTEQRRVEAELRRSNEELEQFAYVASHDLQEPLRMVASFTELLGQRYRGQLDEKADRYIYFAVDGARRMQQLVADLLAYSRVGSQGKAMGPVEIEGVLARVLQVLGPRIQAVEAVVTQDPLPVVWGDELQLQQLLQNLIGNALKFRGAAPPRIHLGARREGGRWVLSCEDNGIGIDSQYHLRIFQMFQRLHERGKYEGSGIGLAIAKRIVERHGGEIWLTSKPDVGTTFYFSLGAPPGMSDERSDLRPAD